HSREQMDAVAPVRVVTVRAFPGRERGMHVRSVEADLRLVVARQAQLVPGLLEEEPGDDPVPQVAGLAVTVLDRGMEVLAGEDVLREVLVAVQALLALELTLLGEGVAAGEDQDRGAGQCEETQESGHAPEAAWRHEVFRSKGRHETRPCQRCAGVTSPWDAAH